MHQSSLIGFNGSIKAKERQREKKVALIIQTYMWGFLPSYLVWGFDDCGSDQMLRDVVTVKAMTHDSHLFHTHQTSQ